MTQAPRFERPLAHTRADSLLRLRTQARGFFHQTLQEVDAHLAVSRSLRVQGLRVFIGGASIDLSRFRNMVIVAVGKAATPMYEAAISVLAPEGVRLPTEAIVVSPQMPKETKDNLTFFHGAHPTPNASSREAATAILKRLHSADERTFVLFLISGGSSSMVELPIDAAISTEDIADFNRILVGSGLSITEINTLRKHLSAVKGGRLAEAAYPATQCTLIISDVPAHSLDIVGSGPSIPDSSSLDDCNEIYWRLQSTQRLPQSIERFFTRRSAPETPKSSHPAFVRAMWSSVLSSDQLASTAAHIASAAGFHVEIDNRCDEWTSEDAAHYLLGRSENMSARHPMSCLISVGEVTVMLPYTRGRGGRNQHFALQCALALADQPSETVVLSVGSDGIDGNSPAAGALADPTTFERALRHGIDPLKTLGEFNSFHLFEALGDLIVTGPTGNNLRDLRMVLTDRLGNAERMRMQ